MGSEVMEVYKTEMTQSEMLLACFQLLLNKGIYPETSPSELLELLLFMHVKGYLYTGLENDKIAIVVGAYRIPEFNDYHTDNVPEEEIGDIWYVTFMASCAEDKLFPKRILTAYLDKHPEVKRIAFYKRGTDKFKIYTRAEYEKEESSGNTN